MNKWEAVGAGLLSGFGEGLQQRATDQKKGIAAEAEDARARGRLRLQDSLARGRTTDQNTYNEKQTADSRAHNAGLLTAENTLKDTLDSGKRGGVYQNEAGEYIVDTLDRYGKPLTTIKASSKEIADSKYGSGGGGKANPKDKALATFDSGTAAILKERRSIMGEEGLLDGEGGVSATTQSRLDALDTQLDEREKERERLFPGVGGYDAANVKKYRASQAETKRIAKATKLDPKVVAKIVSEKYTDSKIDLIASTYDDDKTQKILQTLRESGREDVLDAITQARRIFLSKQKVGFGAGISVPKDTSPPDILTGVQNVADYVTKLPRDVIADVSALNRKMVDSANRD